MPLVPRSLASRSAVPGAPLHALLGASLFCTTLASALGCSCGTPADPGRCVTNTDCTGGRVCIDMRCAPGTTDAGLDASGLDAPPPDAPAADVGPLPGYGCSADLRDVLGADGSVTRTCALDEGCSEGLCVPACDAATASRGTVSCEFVVSSPPAYPPALPPCLAAFVANTWPAPARLTVTRGGTTLDATAFGRIVDNTNPDAATWAPIPATGVPAGAVAVLFLSSDPDAIMPENGVDLSCPITPAVDASTVVSGSGRGAAFRIAADVPVRAYDILPYGGARSHFPSAQLLLPTSTWGTEYVLLGPPPGTYSPPGPLYFHVIGGAAGATVTVRPTVALSASGDLPAVAAGTSGSFTVAPYEVVQWEVGALDPSGTLLVADAPIGVVTGTRFIRLQPTPAPGGEAAHQSLLPADALAPVYVAAPYETRRADLAPEDVPYRLVGVVDGTTLTFDPAVAGAPATLDRGEVVELSSAAPFVVASQDAMHPFAMAQLMPTANLSGGSRPGATAPSAFGLQLGDEEFVVLFPPEQFLSSYVFFSDPAYPTTNVVLVRVAAEDGTFAPVTIDCLGEVTGFRAVGASGDFEMTTVDLVRAGVGAGTPACTNGRHVAESAGRFGLVVWGLDSYSSYAYPGGGNARVLADLPPLF